MAASAAVGYAGPLLPVHPRHETIFGRPAVRTLRELPEPADLAFILAPTEAVATVIEDAAAAGVRNAVVLASGYREAGAGGQELEDDLVEAAASHGIVLLGPNTLGFLNAGAKAAPFALTVPLPLTPARSGSRCKAARCPVRCSPSPGRRPSASAPSRASATRR